MRDTGLGPGIKQRTRNIWSPPSNLSKCKEKCLCLNQQQDICSLETKMISFFALNFLRWQCFIMSNLRQEYTRGKIIDKEKKKKKKEMERKKTLLTDVNASSSSSVNLCTGLFFWRFVLYIENKKKQINSRMHVIMNEI